MRNVLLSLLLAAAVAQTADLPVKQVVLYKHGVGFFERSGTLGPGESARLDFNASDMNDVLKSLTLTDSGGGWPSSRSRSKAANPWRRCSINSKARAWN